MQKIFRLTIDPNVKSRIPSPSGTPAWTQAVGQSMEHLPRRPRLQGGGETFIYGHSPGRETGLGHAGGRATQEHLPRMRG